VEAATTVEAAAATVETTTGVTAAVAAAMTLGQGRRRDDQGRREQGRASQKSNCLVHQDLRMGPLFVSRDRQPRITDRGLNAGNKGLVTETRGLKIINLTISSNENQDERRMNKKYSIHLYIIDPSHDGSRGRPANPIG
jgi:hypothetical protein